MNSPDSPEAPNSSLAVSLTVGQLRALIREELGAVASKNGHEDRLLDVEEASKLLCVSPDYLYRNARRLPFARKLGPKMLRFSYQGMLKWLASRRLP